MGIPKSASFQVLIVPQLSDSAALEIESAALILDEDAAIVNSNYYSGEVSLSDAARYQIVTRDRQQGTRVANNESFFDKAGSLDAYDFFLGKSVYYGALATQTWNDDYSFFWYYPPFEQALLGDIEEVSEAENFFGDKTVSSAENFFGETTDNIVLVSTNLPTGQVGQVYSQSLSATGGTSPYTYTLDSGSLPPGLSIVGSSIEGVPSMQGSFEARIKAVSSDDPALEAIGTFRFNISGQDQIVISTSSLTDGNLGDAYSGAIAATGGNSSDYVYGATGLPTGLSINSSTGAITGTPSVFGAFNVTFTVEDGVSLGAEKVISLYIAQPTANPPLVLDGTNTPDVDENTAYSESRAITGGSGTYTGVTLTAGAFPTGISASIVGTDVVIAGTPTLPGAYSFTLRVTDDDGVYDEATYSMVVIDTADPEIPGTPTLGGVGWNGSDNLANYPKTGEIISIGASGIIVDIDTHATKTPGQMFIEALSNLSTYDRLIIRNNSDALVQLSSPINRSTKWGSKREIFSYGSQRTRIRTTSTSAILSCSGGDEHWKRFAMSGVVNPDGAPLKFQNRFNMNYLFEDIHLHDCASYGWLVWEAGGITLQDFVVYDWNDPVVYTGTNAGEAGVVITGSGGQPSQQVVIVRLYANIPNGDDIVDFFGARNCKLLDSVLRGANPNPVGGDGNGAKMGGRGRTLLSGYNDCVGNLIVSVGVDGITDNGIELPLLVNQNTVWDVGNRAMDINNADGSTVTNNLKHSSESVLTGGATTLAGNNWQAGIEYTPVDAANGDFSYSAASALVGSGDKGQNPGASIPALLLAKAYWNTY